MQGLGEIIRANLQVIGADINRAGKLRRPGKYGVVSRNGDPRDGGPGVPWRVRHAKESNNFLVIQVSDGAVLGIYEKISEARRHVASLIFGKLVVPETLAS